MHIELPEKVRTIIEVIEAAGWEAYAVGGCVRDSVLGRVPDDWDITTSAQPWQVKELFKRTIDTGIQHGTVTVMMDREGFEVTTYRIDGEYEDSRHPTEVIFTADVAEDLKRRDFTMNAMAYNDKKGLLDLFGGIEDMNRGVIRCVGDPEERFGEDALRMLRALRFSAQLGYRIEEGTMAAIGKMAENITRISAERIQTELIKLLLSPHPDYLRTCYTSGITKYIFPEWDRCMVTDQHHPHHCYSVGEHTLEALKHVEADRILRLAVLFHDIGKPETKTTDEKGIDHFYGHGKAGADLSKEILRRWKLDNDTIQKVNRIVYYHDSNIEAVPKKVRRAVYKYGEEIFPLLFPVKKADILAQSNYLREEKLEKLEAVQRVYEEVLEKKDCVSLKQLAVKGKDLIEAGIRPGPELGKMLERLLGAVLERPEDNTREKLLDYAKQWKK